MPEPQIMRVTLVASDLVPVIQGKGAQQGINVSGGSTHLAYDQAHLLLAAEELYMMLRKVVNEAKKSKQRSPLAGGVSDVILKEATELLSRVYSES